mgnify:CR=1 FL=1
MTGPAPRLVIACPNYAPALGGGAVYYRALAEGLAARGRVGRIEVLTEAHPGEPAATTSQDGALVVRRCWPYRSAHPGRQRDRHLRYAREQAGLAALAGRDWPPGSVLLVHGSFHLHPGLLPAALRLLARRRRRPALVADLRDPLIPAARLARTLRPYDAVIACGAAVSRHLAQAPEVAAKAWDIPVLFAAPPPPSDAEAATTARALGLIPGRYVLWTGGLLWRKNLAPALAAVRRLRATAPEVVLAVAGRCRERDARSAAAEAEGTLKLLGPQPHAAMPALARAAGVVVNTARIEGLPRAGLEALAAGARVLLPPDVPEFARHCPDHLAETEDPARLAAQIARALDGALPAPTYPLAAHAPETVLPRYEALLANLECDAIQLDR